MKIIRLGCSLLAMLLALGSAVAPAAKAVWIDVRSLPEHLLDHIDGDPRFDHNDIVEEVQQLYPDPETEIHLYCAVGGRAGIAAEALRQAGYGNVSNADGIADARKARRLAQP